MSPRPVHDTFTVERTYAQPAARVFRAFSDPGRKRRWFAEGEGFVIESYSLDFTVGGLERIRFRAPDGAPMTTDTVFHDIVPEVRIVFAYAMTYRGAPLSSSVATIELLPSPGGTRLVMTEHTVHLQGDASAGRREGTEGLLERLAAHLEEAP
jgi:uncharacterized protein YndB with AHSA1/START domain